MQFINRLKHIKALLVLYGLVCTTEYFYFIYYQFPESTARGEAALTYSTPWLITIREAIFDSATQEIALFGFTFSAALLTAISYGLWLGGKRLFKALAQR